MTLKFKCPECGGDKLEEVVYDALVHLPVERIENEYEISYDYPEIQDGRIDRYQCNCCGYIIEATNSEDLYEWLSKQ